MVGIPPLFQRTHGRENCFTCANQGADELGAICLKYSYSIGPHPFLYVCEEYWGRRCSRVDYDEDGDEDA